MPADEPKPDPPKLRQYEWSLPNGGSAYFRVIWTDPLSEHDMAEFREWLALVSRSFLEARSAR